MDDSTRGLCCLLLLVNSIPFSFFSLSIFQKEVFLWEKRKMKSVCVEEEGVLHSICPPQIGDDEWVGKGGIGYYYYDQSDQDGLWTSGVTHWGVREKEEVLFFFFGFLFPRFSNLKTFLQGVGEKQKTAREIRVGFLSFVCFDFSHGNIPGSLSKRAKGFFGVGERERETRRVPQKYIKSG